MKPIVSSEGRLGPRDLSFWAAGMAKVKRPKQRAQKAPLTKAQRRALAAKASYVGSSEHKVAAWWGGLPGLKVDRNGEVIPRKGKALSTPCPLVTAKERDRASRWVKIALRLGHYKFLEGDKVFPKHIWYQRQGVGWFGFRVQDIAGTYKGWPMEEEQRRAIFD
jgi:hypothetical protein